MTTKFTYGIFRILVWGGLTGMGTWGVGWTSWKDKLISECYSFIWAHHVRSGITLNSGILCKLVTGNPVMGHSTKRSSKGHHDPEIILNVDTISCILAILSDKCTKLYYFVLKIIGLLNSIWYLVHVCKQRHLHS